jgi:hypothetical protein
MLGRIPLRQRGDSTPQVRPLAQQLTTRHQTVMWIVTVVLLGLAALGLSGEVQQRSQRKRSRRNAVLHAKEEANQIASPRETTVR